MGVHPSDLRESSDEPVDGGAGEGRGGNAGVKGSAASLPREVENMGESFFCSRIFPRRVCIYIQDTSHAFSVWDSVEAGLISLKKK